MTNGDESLDDMIRRGIRTDARRSLAVEYANVAIWYRGRAVMMREGTIDEPDQLIVDTMMHVALVWDVAADEMERLARKLTTETAT